MQALTSSGSAVSTGQVDATGASAILKAAFDNLEQGFMVVDAQERVTDFNAQVVAIIGYPAGVMHLGAKVYDLVAASVALGHHTGRSVDEAYAKWRDRLAVGRPATHLGHSSEGRTTKIGYAPIGGGAWVVSYEDISAQVDAERALAKQNERFAAALTNMPHGVCMFDADQRLILCNPGYAELYDLPAELTLAGAKLQCILDYRTSVGNAPIDMSTYFDGAHEARTSGKPGIAFAKLQDGRTMRIAHNAMSDGGFVSTHEDITEAVSAEEHIRHMGTHDALTGLPNRTLLEDRIGEAVLHNPPSGMFCIHYLNLDNFKSVNNVHGHAVGDLLLKQAVQRFASCLSRSDTFARLAGDEFVVLQANTQRAEHAGILARRLVEAMADPFEVQGSPVYLDVSIGVSACPSDGDDAATILRHANTAMYRAKSEGRGTYRFFEVAMDARLQRRRLLELDLRPALAKGEFELHYQPQVDATTELITGCEALLRWKHPARGMVPPSEFIPIAEEIGVIIPLGAWVIERALRDAATWPSHISVSVNLSPAQFKDLALFGSVVAALSASGVSPLRLELEITESALLAESESTMATLEALRRLGVRIVMDDFGTGYSSLNYLRSFPFDKIKIDRSFIKNLGETGDASTIVKAVAALGAVLGMKITAEGVETAEQCRMVCDLGCTEIQGYYFGRPCPAPALLELFRERGLDCAPFENRYATSAKLSVANT